MTTEEFITGWGADGSRLNRITTHRIAKYKLLPATVELLTKAGLPDSAAPFLSFANDVDDKYEGINTLNSKYGLNDDTFDRYVVIGSDGSGNPVAIDMQKNQTVVLLNHEDNFSVIGVMNSSVNHLAECLLHYRNFITSILEVNGPNAYLKADFSDAQFALLKTQLSAADPAAFEGFWSAELNDLLQSRQFYQAE